MSYCRSALLFFVAILAATPTPGIAQPNAQQVLSALIKAGLPITGVVTYNAATDPNSLLGRPGHYTSKADFEDSRHLASADDPEASGNTIEVFTTEAAAQKRQIYTDRIAQSAPFMFQYVIRRRTIVLRLKKAFLPDQAKAYEAALAKILP